MSDETPETPATPPTPPATTASDKESLAPRPERDTPGKILLISYPKLIFLYPTFLATIIAGIVISLSGNEPNTVTFGTTLAFLCIFTVNFVVLTFDFPRTTSLTLFFFVAMLVMGLFTLFTFKPEALAVIGVTVQALKPFANAHFFFLFAAVLASFFIAMMVAVRFDYWEVRPNELLHHHGFLSDLKRYPAPNLRIDKEINDVFEYMLLRSGRLILHARHETRAIVLDNVIFINHKEQLLTKMLGALQVSVRDDE